MRWALARVAVLNGEEIASHDHCHSPETGGYPHGIASPGALRWAVMFASIIVYCSGRGLLGPGLVPHGD